MTMQQHLDQELDNENYKNPVEKFDKISLKLYTCTKYIQDQTIRRNLIELLYMANSIKESPTKNIYQLIDVLERVFLTLISAEKANEIHASSLDKKEHQENINKLLEYADEVNGHPSLKLQIFGFLLMLLAVSFIVASSLSFFFGLQAFLPNTGANVILGMFGLTPALAGIKLFQYGYNIFQKGQRHSLSEKLSIFAHSTQCRKNTILISEAKADAEIKNVLAWEPQ